MEANKHRPYAEAGDPSGKGKCRVRLAMRSLLLACLLVRAVCAEAGTWRIDFQGDPGGVDASAGPVSPTFNLGGGTWNVLQPAAANEGAINGVSDPTVGGLENGEELYAEAGKFSGEINDIEVVDDGILEGTPGDADVDPSLAAMVLTRKIRILMVSGGGFHNFPERQKVLVSGLSTRLNIEWTIVPTIDLKSGWADPYDVILYDICSTGFPGVTRVSGITEPHFQGKAAVAIHCTHHSYAPTSAKSAEANWPQFLGAISSKHIHGSPMEIGPPPDRPAHRILSGVEMPWNLPEPAPGERPDELYVIDHLEETAEVVAWGTNEDGITHPVVWTNRFGRGRVFATTLAHLTATLAEDTFLDVLANGIAWALVETEKLTPTPSPTSTPMPAPAEGVISFP